jgi:hypothetical protein
MTCKELLDGTNTEAINHVRSQLERDAPTEDDLTTFIWLTRLEKWVKVLKARLVATANNDFKAMQDAQPNLKTWQPVPFAVLRAQTGVTSWTYPSEILDLEAELRAKKEASKAGNTAQSNKNELDPGVDQLFKVSLTAC